jgi:hypothetical protein
MFSSMGKRKQSLELSRPVWDESVLWTLYMRAATVCQAQIIIYTFSHGILIKIL